MSKIGQQAIEIPNTLSVEINQGLVLVKGPVDQIIVRIPKELSIDRQDNKLLVIRKNESKKVKAIHGLIRQLISNAVIGVEKPWEKRLEIVGTGYNAKMQGEDIILKLGYSHPVVFKKVVGIKTKVEGNNKVIVSGADKQLVGQIAHQIKMLKKPDVYKGKGIRYEGEKLRIKPGKKAKAAGAPA